MKELIVLLKCYCALKMEEGVGQNKMTLSNFGKIALKQKEGVINEMKERSTFWAALNSKKFDYLIFTFGKLSEYTNMLKKCSMEIKC